MKTRKKPLAFLLVLTLIMTSLPAQLFANEVVKAPINLQTDLLGSERTTPGIIDINPNVFVGNGYMVEFKVNTQWEGAFNGEFILTNTGEKALENWTLAFDFEHEINNIWNAQISKHEGTSYIIKNLGWNQDIAPGSSVSIGFGASWGEYINPPKSYNLLNSEQQVGDTDYTIDFKVVSDWGQAFNGEISITNNTEEPIEDWTLAFDFDRNIDRFWTAEIVKREGNHYIIKNLGYNANIAPGQTLALGFAGNPGNVDNEPSGYKLTHIEQEIDEDIDYITDTDGDGLSDFLEKQLGTNLNKLDTDEDVLPDGYEYFDLGTDPLKTDTDDNGVIDGDEDFDEDGLTNLKEYHFSTNPYNNDTDKDGLTDGDEVNRFNTDPLVFDEIDTALDTDNDGLADGLEIRIGTDPYLKDTDGDALPDGYEFSVLQTDPLKKDTDDNNITDGDEDFDQDGLTNLEEYLLGTIPYNNDTDNDGLTDEEEVNQYHTNALIYDTDGDGIGDGDEIKLGLNPLSTSTHGIPDNEYMIDQSVSEEVLAYVNTSNNSYTLKVDLKASGNAADNVIVAKSQYANTISTNKAVVGETISIDYFEGKIEEGTLSFTLDESVIEQVNVVNDKRLEELKRYYVFNYNEDAGILVPVPTTYNNENNTLVADIVTTGTYCVIDLEKWLLDMGVVEETSKTVLETNMAIQLTSSINYLEAPVQSLNQLNMTNEAEEVVLSNKQKQVDLVFVVDTGYTMRAVEDSVKTGMKEIINILKEQNVDLSVSIIEYADLTRVDSSEAVKINGVLATEAEGNKELSFTSDTAKITAFIDNITPNSAYGTDREISGTPLAGLGYVTTLPFRKNAAKFTLLITDKAYKVNNCHGFTSMFNLLDYLKANEISLSISTMSIPTEGSLPDTTVADYRRWLTRVDGIFVLLRNFNTSKSVFLDFISTTLAEKKDFVILGSNNLGPIVLDSPLVKGGNTDTDADSLTDSEEVKWGDEEYGEDAVSVKYTADGYELPCLQDLWGDIYIRYGYDCADFPFSEEMANIKVLPVLSDPTLKDSDDDGLLDFEDDKPFINNFKTIWYKMNFNEKDIYFGQMKYGDKNARFIVCELENKEGIVYKFEDNKWVPSNENIILPGSNSINYKEDTLVIEHPDQGIVIDLNKSFDFSMEETIAGYLKEVGETAALSKWGQMMGTIDAVFPNEVNGFKVMSMFAYMKMTNMTEESGGKYVLNSILPRSEQINSFIFPYLGLDKDEIENNYVYLTSKITAERCIEVASIYASMYSFVSLIGNGVKIAGSALSILVTEGGTTYYAIAISTEAVAEIAVVTQVSILASKISKNAGDCVKRDTLKLADSINPKVKKIIDKIPDKFKANYKCDDFAKELVKGLKKEGIKHEIIKIESDAGIYSDRLRMRIGTNRYHYGIKIGNMTYDNMTLNGMSSDAWLTDLAADGSFANITSRVVQTITSH